MESCMRCGRCCTSFGVCVTPFDIIRLSKATGRNASDFVMAVEEPPERERGEPAVLIRGMRSLIVLKWRSGRDCMFYDGKGCSIYNDRPMLCRTYPFILHGGRLQSLRCRACPVPWKADKSYGFDLEKYESEVNAYRRIADKWNHTGGGTLGQFLDFAVAEAGAAFK